MIKQLWQEKYLKNPTLMQNPYQTRNREFPKLYTKHLQKHLPDTVSFCERQNTHHLSLAERRMFSLITLTSY